MNSEKQWGAELRSLDRDRDGVVSAPDIQSLFSGCGIRGSRENAEMLVENVLECTGSKVELSVRSGLKGLSGRTLEQFCTKIMQLGPENDWRNRSLECAIRLLCGRQEAATSGSIENCAKMLK